jgi:L-ribulose-5-phosphate 4-epimerase
MLEALKSEVHQANLQLVREGLVLHTWGNASGIDRDKGCVVIKPSGVAYDEMEPEHMVVVSLEDGSTVEGDLRPSSDTATHLELYRGFEGIGGVVHTHSLCATAWAQTQKPIPVLGTTHADYFYGPVPMTRGLEPAEIQDAYERNTGKVIVEKFTRDQLNPKHLPGVLVAAHGPFTWGQSPSEAAFHATILEHLSLLASETLRLCGYPPRFCPELLDKHFLRKHGQDAYYGQK